MRSRGATGRLLLRAPNHLGEVILAIPALRHAVAAESRTSGERPAIQVVRWLVPVLEMAALDAELIPLDDRRAILGAARVVKDLGCDRAIILTPAFSAALIVRVAGVPSRRGTAAGGRGFLLTDPVDREPLLRGHRVDEFLALVDPQHRASAEPPAPRLTSIDRAVRAWEQLANRQEIPETAARTIGLIPSAQATSRRWPVDRFAEIAERFAAAGDQVLVFGGPTDRAVTRAVVESTSDGLDVWDLGGRTSLEEVTGGLSGCDLVVTNDSGPMHLAAALDRPIVAIEGPADIRQTRPVAERVTLVGRFDLPCVPCVKNECPRRGAGYELPEARRECLQLVTVGDVYEAAQRQLQRN